MTRISNKRAAVEMSLNLIIMLIIGMVVLGLVIGFVSNLINQGSAGLEDQLTQEGQERERVLATAGVFAVGPTQFQINPGGEKNIFLKVYNPTEDTIQLIGFNGEILTGDVVEAGTVDGVSLTADSTWVSGTQGNCEISVISAPLSVASNDQQIMTVSVQASNACPIDGSFFVTFTYSPTADTLETISISGSTSE